MCSVNVLRSMSIQVLCYFYIVVVPFAADVSDVPRVVHSSKYTYRILTCSNYSSFLLSPRRGVYFLSLCCYSIDKIKQWQEQVMEHNVAFLIMFRFSKTPLRFELRVWTLAMFNRRIMSQGFI